MIVKIEKMNQIPKELNLISLLPILAIILTASIIQFNQNEIPCPLCLLQRAGLLAIALGFLLNLQSRIRASHYSLSILAALFTAAVAIRQTLLHIAPGTGGYGSPIFGLNMYVPVIPAKAGI